MVYWYIISLRKHTLRVAENRSEINNNKRVGPRSALTYGAAATDGV